MKNKTLKKNTKPVNITKVFLEMSNTVKLYHWKTLSYSTHNATDELYKDLPILILKSWDEINEKLLHDFYCEYKNKICNNEYNLQKLQLEYWIKKIEEK